MELTSELLSGVLPGPIWHALKLKQLIRHFPFSMITTEEVQFEIPNGVMTKLYVQRLGRYLFGVSVIDKGSEPRLLARIDIMEIDDQSGMPAEPIDPDSNLLEDGDRGRRLLVHYLRSHVVPERIMCSFEQQLEVSDLWTVARVADPLMMKTIANGALNEGDTIDMDRMMRIVSQFRYIPYLNGVRMLCSAAKEPETTSP